MVDLADDLLLAGVELHYVLSTCVGLRCRPELDGGVGVALCWIGP
jgi:hypothetical protein